MKLNRKNTIYFYTQILQQIHYNMLSIWNKQDATTNQYGCLNLFFFNALLWLAVTLLNSITQVIYSISMQVKSNHKNCWSISLYLTYVKKYPLTMKISSHWFYFCGTATDYFTEYFRYAVRLYFLSKLANIFISWLVW
jgi:hypothetical protein